MAQIRVSLSSLERGLLLTNPAGAALFCAMLTIFTVLAGLAILCTRTGGFDMRKAVYRKRKEEGGDDQQEESFHIFKV